MWKVFKPRCKISSLMTSYTIAMNKPTFKNNTMQNVTVWKSLDTMCNSFPSISLKRGSLKLLLDLQLATADKITKYFFHRNVRDPVERFLRRCRNIGYLLEWPSLQMRKPAGKAQGPWTWTFLSNKHPHDTSEKNKRPNASHKRLLSKSEICISPDTTKTVFLTPNFTSLHV